MATGAQITSTPADSDTAHEAVPPDPAASPDEPDETAGWALSPSRAADFMACPLLYRFRTIDRLPERPSPEATRGTVVHGVLEQLFDLAAGERTVERARALIEPVWAELLEAEPDVAELFVDDEDGSALRDWLAAGGALLERYFALEDPTRLEPEARELYVETTLESGLRLRGYVDRLDRAPASGAMRVVDYKTGRAPREGFEDRAMFQMRFYGLVLWRQTGQVPKLLQLMYLGSGEVLRYEPDEADLRATERKIAALWRAIERALTTGDWRASPSRLCDWCDHKPLCPAWGGTPPPLPEVTGPTNGTDEAPSPRTSPVDA
jgi:putative RecB family exonuclease